VGRNDNDKSPDLDLNDAMGVYNLHLYYGTLNLASSVREELGDGQWLIYLCKLYFLGDLLQDKDFKAAILDEMKGGSATAFLEMAVWVHNQQIPSDNLLSQCVADSFAVYEKFPHVNFQGWGNKDSIEIMLGKEAFLRKYATDEPPVGYSIHGHKLGARGFGRLHPPYELSA
jgi:hypothetical protein